MSAKQIDRVLTRRLYLQRYITQVVRDLLREIDAGDRLVMDLSVEFFDNANDAQRSALSRARRAVPEVGSFLRSVEDLLDLQRIATRDFIRSELERMLDEELDHIAKTWDMRRPSKIGIALDPVGGKTINQWVDGAFKAYTAKVLADLVMAGRNPDSNVRALFRGTRALARTDGLISWRMRRMLEPMVDSLFNGKANQAAEENVPTKPGRPNGLARDP